MSHYPAPQPNQKPAQKSFGELMFDGAVYGGIGYLANAAVSLAVSHHAVNLPESWLGQQSKKSRAMFADIAKSITENPEQIERWSNRANDILFLGSGGWLLLIPMKWMEDSKSALVTQIDHLFGTGPQTEADKQSQLARLESAPKQSYLSLFGGRSITYPLIIGAALPVMTKLKGNEYLNDLLEKHAKGIFEGFQQPKKLIDLTSQEIILAGTGAVLLYGLSKGIAYFEHAVNPPSDPQKSESPFTQVADVAHIGQATAAPEAGIRHHNG